MSHLSACLLISFLFGLAVTRIPTPTRRSPINPAELRRMKQITIHSNLLKLEGRLTNLEHLLDMKSQKDVVGPEYHTGARISARPQKTLKTRDIRVSLTPKKSFNANIKGDGVIHPNSNKGFADKYGKMAMELGNLHPNHQLAQEETSDQPALKINRKILAQVSITSHDWEAIMLVGLCTMGIVIIFLVFCLCCESSKGKIL